MHNVEAKNRIEEALNLREMKQIELAEKSGVSKTSINHWVKQRYQPKQTPLLKMARALDVSEMWLAGYDVPMERPVEQKNADELALLIHQLRKNEDLKELFMSIAKLSAAQLSIVKSLVSEFNSQQ